MDAGMTKTSMKAGVGVGLTMGIVIGVIGIIVVLDSMGHIHAHSPCSPSRMYKKLRGKRSIHAGRGRKANRGYRLNTTDMDFEDDTRGKTIKMNLPPTHMLANGERRMNPSVLNSASGRLAADNIVME